MTMVGGWEQLNPLGEGGQGTVYRARTPERVTERGAALTTMISNLPYGSFSIDDKRAIGDQFAAALWTYARPDDASEVGALKIFKSDPDPAKLAEALGRFKNEIAILRENRPGLLKLLDCSENEGWIVTEIMPGGTIADHPKFKGDALGALEAFRSLVKTVASLHQDPTVHRDIKPANIFFGDAGNLVLGDFGIVYLPNQIQHLTVTDERVGSRDYMPPWADVGERFEDVEPNFDVYMLGKLLWCMVSGRLKLPREDFKKEKYDLTRKFPNDPDIHSVNAILEKCVVEDPKECLPSALQLLPLVEQTVSRMERGGHSLADGIPRPCRVCGEGYYQPYDQPNLFLHLQSGTAPLNMPVRPFICGNCQHVEFFLFTT